MISINEMIIQNHRIEKEIKKTNHRIKIF